MEKPNHNNYLETIAHFAVIQHLPKADQITSAYVLLLTGIILIVLTMKEEEMCLIINTKGIDLK